MIQMTNLWPTWRDEASVCEDMGRRSDVRNVWARVGDVEEHSAVAPTLLDSLAEDLWVAQPNTNLGDVGRIGVQSPRGADAPDECSSASSASDGGRVGDEAVECCVLLRPPSGQAGNRVGHREVNRERRARRLLLISSQTVPPSLTCNRFAALDDHVDIPRHSESVRSLPAVRTWCTLAHQGRSCPVK